jgi:gliding motility-associated-like protein
MHTPARISLLLLFMAIYCSNFGQLPEKYFFFKGDTLRGFDLNACYQQVLDEQLSDSALKEYIRNREQRFVENRFSISLSRNTSSSRLLAPTSPCNNIDFENSDFSGWTGYTGFNNNSRGALTQGAAGLPTLGTNSSETSCSMFTLESTGSGTDPWGSFPMLDPLTGGGNYSLRMGGENTNYQNATCISTGGISSPGECIQQTFPVSASNALFTYDYAVVLEQGTGHDSSQCPYFRAEVLDQNGNTIPCLQYYVESVASGVPPGMSVSPNVFGGFGGTPVYYSAWKTNTMNLKSYIGQNVTVRFTTAGCIPGGHFGYAYVDAHCGPIQVLASTPSVCAGGSVILTAPGAGATGTYTWQTMPSGTAGIAGPTNGQSVTINATGTYQVTVSQGPGCFYVIDTTITFYPNPILSIAPTNASCSPGNDGTATATVTAGNAPYTYTWSPGNPTGQGTATITGLSAGTYNLSVTSVNGCTASGSVTIAQPPGAPVITLTNTPSSCSPGNDGTASATVVGGTTPYTYSWTTANGTIGSGQGSSSISGLTAGTYTLTVTTTNTACPAAANTIITQPNGPTASSTATDVSCFGLKDGSATAIGSGGSAPMSYSWSPVNSNSATASGLGTGTYTCTISDSKGCAVRVIDTVKQPPLLSVKAVGTNPTCHNVCNGGLISVPTGGTSAYTYSWSSNCMQASCANVCPGKYTITLTDAHHCHATDTITITQPPGMVMTFGFKPTHCGKADGSDTVHVSGGTPGYTYTWIPLGGTANVATGIPAGTYTVIVKDSHGCLDTSSNTVTNLPGITIKIDSTRNVTCFGGSDGMAAATASGGFPAYTYSWNNGQTAPKATGLSAGAYTCTVVDSAGCRNNVITSIFQPPLLVLTPKPSTICIGNCTDLVSQAVGGTPVYTYSWTLNGSPTPTHVCPAVSTAYVGIVTDAHGCLATAPVIITVNPPLEVTASGGKPICPGGSAQLNADGHGGNNGPYTYTWIPPSGLSSSTIPNPVATPTVTTIYTVIIADNCGTPTDSSMTTVTVFPAPVLNLTYKDSVICGPDCFKFTATSTTGCASATWTFGDGTKTNGCNSAKHCYNKAGPYTVTYTILDGNGCPGTVSVIDTANLLPIPVAEFSYTPNPASILAPTITFTDQSSGPPVTWDWHFGNPGDSSTMIQNPVFTYTDTGCYTVTLLVSAADGCTSQVSHPVCIQPYFTFYAPNTFTPNGDGKNDIWMPYGIGIDPNNYDLIMFDRWGNLMFETHVWGEGWDGRANHGAEIAQIDTYVWKVVLKDVFHIKHQYMGHCNIIR